jgi:hypothetical protein
MLSEVYRGPSHCQRYLRLVFSPSLQEVVSQLFHPFLIYLFSSSPNSSPLPLIDLLDPDLFLNPVQDEFDSSASLTESA